MPDGLNKPTDETPAHLRRKTMAVCPRVQCQGAYTRLEAERDELREARDMLAARCDELHADLAVLIQGDTPSIERSYLAVRRERDELRAALTDAIRYMPDEPCDTGDCDACWTTCRAMSDRERYERLIARAALTNNQEPTTDA